MDTGERGRQGAFLTDHSKAFDCFFHDLLITNLNAYGVESLRFLYVFTLKIENIGPKSTHNSQYSEIIFGVPQGLILSPFSFNI